MFASPHMLRRLSRGPSAAAAVFLVATLSACAHRDNLLRAPVATPEPFPVAATMDRGQQAYENEDWAAAETAFLAAAREAPDDAEPWFKLGNVYYRTARYDLAAQAYEQCLRRAPGHGKAWHNLGIIRLHQADQSFEQVDQSPVPHDAALAARARRLRAILDEAIAPGHESP